MIRYHPFATGLVLWVFPGWLDTLFKEVAIYYTHIIID